MKEKKAVALKKKETSIKVVGKGKGYIAKKIIEIARQKGIPIEEDAELVEKLFGIDLYEDVPPELYEYIVKVLDFLYNKKKDQGV